MLDKLTAIAPLSTWALVVASTLIFVCGFVTFSHAWLVRKAYREAWNGARAPGTLETMTRWTGVLLPLGLLLWGIALGWPLALLLPLGAACAGCLAMEAVARLRG